MIVADRAMPGLRRQASGVAQGPTLERSNAWRVAAGSWVASPCFVT